MANGPRSTGSGWARRFSIAVALVLVGAVAAAWILARYEGAARFLGVTPQSVESEADKEPVLAPARLIAPPTVQSVDGERIAELEARLQRVETAAERVEGSAGRADALLVAFAARRAMDRGVALGFLEPLLVERFGATNPRAVSTIVSGARSPVRLNELIEEYRRLGPSLRAPAADEGWWEGFKQELGTLVSVRRSDRPSPSPDARYDRALEHLSDGAVDAALAETMRLPGASRASAWAAKARQHIAVQRALDEIETAALLGRTRPSSQQTG